MPPFVQTVWPNAHSPTSHAPPLQLPFMSNVPKPGSTQFCSSPGSGEPGGLSSTSESQSSSAALQISGLPELGGGQVSWPLLQTQRPGWQMPTPGAQMSPTGGGGPSSTRVSQSSSMPL